MLREVQADRLDESAALIAHHHETAGETLVAARWHRRAAEWAGLTDIMSAFHHWQKVRELARLWGRRDRIGCAHGRGVYTGFRSRVANRGVSDSGGGTFRGGQRPCASFRCCVATPWTAAVRNRLSGYCGSKLS